MFVEMLARMLHAVSPRSQPLMTRQSYQRELVSAMTFSMAIAMMDGSVIAVLAEKVFHVSGWAFATILAAPMFANLTSFFWAYSARGRRKVRFISMLQVAVLTVTATVAFLPSGQWGGLLLVALVISCRCLLAGIVTIRSTLWRMNYPRQARAQVTGKLVLVATMVLATTPLLGYALLDINVQWFRGLYIVAIAVSLVGVFAFWKIRLRGERALLAFERQPLARPQAHGIPGPIYEYDPKMPTDQRQSFLAVLRRDHFFRRYMFWQFAAGMANMMGEVAIISLIVSWTQGMAMEFRISIVLISTIPMVVTSLTLPLWARYFDKVHITKFRSWHGLFWIAAQFGYWLVACFGSLGWLVIPRIIQGFVRGGGLLAWNLGHNDFANRRMVALYMGIHVTLTGVRGVIAPYLAIVLLYGWGDPAQATTSLLPNFPGIGAHLFLLTTALATAATLGYWQLYRSIKTQAAAST